MDSVAILCNKDHEILSEVSKILEDEGVRTEFVDPERKLTVSEIREYEAIIPKKSRRAVYHNLRIAEAGEVETLNSLRTNMTADNNLASMYHLRENGFNVPSLVEERSESGVVEKPLLESSRDEPRKLNGERFREGDYIMEEFIPSDGIDYKIYLIDGEELSVYGVRTGSKLFERNGGRERFEPEDIGFGTEEAADMVSAFYDADFLGVDIIMNNGKPYVVDVNSAPSFRGIDEAPQEIAEAVFYRL